MTIKAAKFEFQRRAMTRRLVTAALAGLFWMSLPSLDGYAANKDGGGAFPTETKKVPAKPGNTTSPGETIGGTWKTDGENETLNFPNVSAGYVRASYSPNSGNIYGQLQNRRLSGVWAGGVSRQACDVEKHGTKYWGRLSFTFNANYDRFQGVWGHCDGPLHIPWSAKKIGR